MSWGRFFRGAAVATLCWSCVPTTSSIRAEGDAQSEAARRAARAELPRIQGSWQRENSTIFADWKASLLFPYCTTDLPTGSRCGLVADRYDPVGYQQFVSERCIAEDDDCWKLFISTFLNELRSTYGLERRAWLGISPPQLRAALCGPDRSPRCVLSSGAIRCLRAAYIARRCSSRPAAENRYQNEVARIDRETDEAVADAERRRAEMAAALQAIGDDLARERVKERSEMREVAV